MLDENVWRGRKERMLIFLLCDNLSIFDNGQNEY